MQHQEIEPAPARARASLDRHVEGATGVDGPEPAQDLIEALRRGDEAAFVALVNRYQRSLLRVVRGFVPRREVAEEVVQETWLAVLEGIGRFQGRSSLKTWITRIAVNRAITRSKREGRTVTFSDLARAISSTTRRSWSRSASPGPTHGGLATGSPILDPGARSYSSAGRPEPCSSRRSIRSPRCNERSSRCETSTAARPRRCVTLSESPRPISECSSTGPAPGCEERWRHTWRGGRLPPS